MLCILLESCAVVLFAQLRGGVCRARIAQLQTWKDPHGSAHLRLKFLQTGGKKKGIICIL